MVYFIGAGSGDPDLITVKGKALLEKADIVIYAGSLVNPVLLECCPEDCEIHDSSKMTLGEVIDISVRGCRDGKMVVRLHTGDPSIYGAIREQMAELDKHGIEYQVVPGVSSFLAAAASLKMEYTLPSVSQTVILTRMEGRTPVPVAESIESLAKHGATMVIFLSVHMMAELVDKLRCGYDENTPVAVVYKASWPDEKIIKGTLKDIATKVIDEGIKSTALVMVGNFLGNEFELSKLYDENFGHGFRNAKTE